MNLKNRTWSHDIIRLEPQKSSSSKIGSRGSSRDLFWAKMRQSQAKTRFRLSNRDHRVQRQKFSRKITVAYYLLNYLPDEINYTNKLKIIKFTYQVLKSYVCCENMIRTDPAAEPNSVSGSNQALDEFRKIKTQKKTLSELAKMFKYLEIVVVV